MNPTTPVLNGHWPTLAASFLHFDLSFMLWVLLGALGVYIAEAAGLGPAEKGFVVSVPILSGALLRIPMGLLSDRIGAKRTGVGLLAFLFLPLALGWQTGNSLPTLLGIGLLLGTAGASFAVALPLASRWYPQERQGLVMGIAAAGNSGTVIANLLAPRLANIMGWQNVLALAMVPLAVVLLAFLLMAKESPYPSDKSRGASPLTALKERDLWWFCLFYSVTFGGYVGLSSFLPIFLRDQYHLSPVTAGYLTALLAFVGSGVRPLGGYMADRFGGTRLLLLLLVGIGCAYAALSQMPPLGVLIGLLVLGIACLGMGNGATFQLVPQRFPVEIGMATGVVGAFGGLGGFLLPNLLSNAKALSGSFGLGFLVLAGIAGAALLLLIALVYRDEGWRLAWLVRRQPATMEMAPTGRVVMAPYLMS